MSMINYASREINCKLVYYGPGLGGKTTNLEHVYNKVAPGSRGKMISLATETERTLFFDFLPVDLGSVRGFKIAVEHGFYFRGSISAEVDFEIDRFASSRHDHWSLCFGCGSTSQALQCHQRLTRLQGSHHHVGVAAAGKDHFALLI